MILQLATTQSDILDHTPTSDTHSSRIESTLVLFLHLQSIYTSRTFKFDHKTTHPIITSEKNRSRKSSYGDSELSISKQYDDTGEFPLD